MKWQDKFLTYNEEEMILVNEYLVNLGDEPRISYRETFRRDGRLALFYSYPTSRDVDLAAFPELNFTQKAQEELKSERELNDLMNVWRREMGLPEENCREDRLLREGKLEKHLRNILLDTDHWKSDDPEINKMK